jgi:CRISPR/Cas system CMR subunit Cmr4 (Cas7 group RAMP superfamily)
MMILIRLISDSAFGRGDGVIGVVDSEVEHDKATGLPIIKGRTIKGLLVESCADLLYAIGLQNDAFHAELEASAARLFAQPVVNIRHMLARHLIEAIQQ